MLLKSVAIGHEPLKQNSTLKSLEDKFYTSWFLTDDAWKSIETILSAKALSELDFFADILVTSLVFFKMMILGVDYHDIICYSNLIYAIPVACGRIHNNSFINVI